MSNRKDLTASQETALELLIDECGLCAVLQSLSSICDQKGLHILESYSDHALSKAWAAAGGEIGMCSVASNVIKIGRG